MISQFTYIVLYVLILASKIKAMIKHEGESEKLRALWNLDEMSECRLHYNALAYNDYGCWCGIGGSGKPMDGIDDCCMHHDKCYDAAVDSRICYDVEWEYIDDYSWACNKSNNEPICYDKLEGCQKALCDCDKHLVDCWAKFSRPEKKVSCVPHRSTLISWAKEIIQITWDFVRSIPERIVNIFG